MPERDIPQPPLLLYTMAVFMKIMGPTDLAALLPFALLGIGTVAVVYGIGYRLGGRMMGLASAALLAAMPFHVEMSRRAMLRGGGMRGSRSTPNQPASAISWPSTRISPPAYSAVKPTMSERPKGQGWLPK